MNEKGEITICDVAEKITKSDKMLEFLGDYNYETEVVRLRNDLETGAMAMLSAGCRLLRIKEHEVKGTFSTTLEKIGLTWGSACRFMTSALKFVSGDTGKVKYPQLVQQGASKIYELALLDDEELSDLEAGKSVADITLDDVDKMSVRELKRALRDKKEREKALEQVLQDKNAKIDNLSMKLEKAENREIPDSTDFINQMMPKVQIILAEGVQLANKIRAYTKDIEDALPPEIDKQAVFRTLFRTFSGAVLGAREEIARAEMELENTTPESFAVCPELPEEDGAEFEI